MFRLFHSSSCLQSVSKSALAKLRKKTGYTFANCRKALELHENDVCKAEAWLHEQAKAMGWEKASKLQGRPTSQGLIGVTITPNRATMVEINCETDFVARNSKFKSLVEMVTATCLHYPVPSDAQLNKVSLNTEQLKELTNDDGKLLADQVALLIGNVGENIILRRAVSYSTLPGIHLAAFSHPPPSAPSSIHLGKYGSIVAYTTNPDVQAEGKIPQEEIGRQLCQHVIGMNPQQVGCLEVESEDDSTRDENPTRDENSTRDNNPARDENLTGDDNPTRDDNPEKTEKDETSMLRQEFLMDPSLTVGQWLGEVGAEVLEFRRFECGEVEGVEEEVEHKVRAEVESG